LRLHWLCVNCRFSRAYKAPPRARGTIWSTSTAIGENAGASISIYLWQIAHIGSRVAIARLRAFDHSVLFQVCFLGELSIVNYGFVYSIITYPVNAVLSVPAVISILPEFRFIAIAAVIDDDDTNGSGTLTAPVTAKP